MKLKGFNKFREKIPYFSGKKIVFLPLFFISVNIMSTLFLYSFYLLPLLLPTNEIFNYLKPWFPILGELTTGIIGLTLVYQMWAHRDRLKKKHGQKSYQKIFLIGLSGVVVIFSIVTQTIFPFYIWIPFFWTDIPHTFFTTSITSFMPVIGDLFDLLCFILGIILIIIAFLMIYRAINTFGFDYMAVVYLYFPEESEIQNHEIYSVLRHPTYTALILICLGGIFIHLNFYSVAFFAIFLTGMYIHVHFVEEKELIKRFGASYKDFRKQVPAFFVRPKNLKTFLKYILGRK